MCCAVSTLASARDRDDDTLHGELDRIVRAVTSASRPGTPDGASHAISAVVAAFVVALVGAGCASVAPHVPAASAPVAAASLPSWTVQLEPGVDVDRGLVNTRVCFSGAPPARVGPEHRAALAFLVSPPQARTANGDVIAAALEVDDAGIVTDGLPPHACVVFSLDLEKAARHIDRLDVAQVLHRVVMASPDVWLWRPWPWPAHGAVGTLVIEPAVDVALPFAHRHGAYVVPQSAFTLQSYAAFGRFAAREQRRRHGVVLDVVHLLDSGLAPPRFGAFLDVAVDDVAAPLGRFPVERVLVLVCSTPGNRPIVAGYLGRGGGLGAVIVVDDAMDAVDAPGSLLADNVQRLPESEPHAADAGEVDDGRWVLTHELAHTLLPPIRRADAWFNEGLATWHQEILPVRAGRRARDVASASLARGFRTGAARAARDGLSLSRACAERDQRGSDQHCYWGGAAVIELLADEVGDDGVFALVGAVHGLSAVDAAPASAEAVLVAVIQSPTSTLSAQRAAERLLVLWARYRDGLFPDVEAIRDSVTRDWPDAS